MFAAALITETLVEHEEATADAAGIPAWLWPNVVSLDAPIVAVLWQVLLARSLRVSVSPAEPLVLGLAVWTIYVGDRVLDALRPGVTGWEPARKRFYRRQGRSALAVAVGATLSVLALAYAWLNRAVFQGGLTVACGVLCYFGLVHIGPARWRARWPREAAVAMVFALGTFLGVWSANGNRIQPLAAPAVLFGLLCWVNCSAIESWEWESAQTGEAPSESARWAARHLTLVATVIAMVAAVMGFLSLAPMELAVVAFWSGIGLAALGACRAGIRVSVLRVAADVALCTPLIALAGDWVR